MSATTYPVGPRSSCEVVTRSGDIRIDVADVDAVTVTIERPDHYEISHVGGRVSVRPMSGAMRGGSSLVLVEIPHDSDLEVSSASGSITVRGTIGGGVRIKTAAGDVSVDDVSADLRLKTASGDVRVGDVGGRASIATASGDVRVDSVALDLEVRTASGDIGVGRLGGDCDVSSASGDLAVVNCSGSHATVRTLSGDVMLGLPPRRSVSLDFKSLSGSRINELDPPSGEPPEANCSIAVKSVSGDLTLRSAP